MVTRDLNINLYDLEGYQREEEIVAALTAAGLEDMLAHFLLQRHLRDGRTWRIVRVGREVWSRTDYIPGTDFCIFRNVAVRDPRHNLDHYLVLGCLRNSPLRKHTEYLGRRKRSPLRPLITPMREEGIFAALRRSIPKPKSREARKKALILAAMWRLADERVSAHRDPAKYQAHIWRLGCAINVNLK